MALSPLKFSLGISLVIHGVALGGALWLARRPHPAAPVEVSETATLELIAAPSSPEPASEPALAPVVPPPSVTAPPSPAVEPVLPEKLVELAPAETAIIPPSAPVPEPGAPAVAVVDTPPQRTALPPAASERGDNSSALPGRDATTVAGKPTALAQPDYLKNPEPIYPLAARRRHQEGLVVVNVRVNRTGRALSVSLKQSSGYPLLDDAALTQVREWEFAPARIGTQAVESEIEVPVRFKLTH